VPRIGRQLCGVLLLIFSLHAATNRLADGKHAFSLGRYEEAIRLLGEAKDGADGCEAGFYSGLAHYRLKQFNPAIIHLQSSILCAPDNADSYIALAAAYSDKGDDDHAVAALDASLELQPGNVEALRAAAILDLKHERNDRAVTKLEKLVALEPNIAQAHSELGAAYAGTGNLDKAREQFQQALKLSPEDASALLGLGRIFEKSGQVEDALRTLTHAVKADPRAYQPHFLLASAYNTLGRFSEALAEFGESIRLGGTDPEVYYQMARAYRGVARPKDARKSLERFSALRLKSGREVEGSRQAARLLLQAKPLVAEGKLPEAIALLEQAVSLENHNPQILFRLAGLYYDTKQFPRARNSVQAAIDLAPSEYIYHYLSGLIEKDSGSPETAAKSFETAIMLNPSAADGFNQLGNLAMSGRRFAEAIRFFEKASQLDPAEPAYLINLKVAQDLGAKPVK